MLLVQQQPPIAPESMEPAVKDLVQEALQHEAPLFAWLSGGFGAGNNS